MGKGHQKVSIEEKQIKDLKRHNTLTEKKYKFLFFLTWLTGND